MANSPLATTSIETGSANSIETVSQDLAALQVEHTNNVSGITQAFITHVDRGVEAHGGVLTSTRYLDSHSDFVGAAFLFPTTLGNLYVPCSTSPAGVS